MLGFKKKEKEGGESTNDNSSSDTSEGDKKEDKEQVSLSEQSNLNLTRVATEVDRIKVSVEGFQEVRKSFNERFTRVSEQIGELRAMILERDKSIQEIELKAMKAHDLVEAVHPEKIMTEVQKEDAKVEALKANIEGHEAIMGRVMEELKDTKRKVEFFRGVEEIIKLSEEVKSELIEIKKIESRVSIEADKVDTIYAEMRKKLQDIDSFNSEIQEMKVMIQQNSKDIAFLKDKITGLVEKPELEKLVNKVQRYIDALKEIEKSSSLTKDIATLRTILESLK